MSLTMESVLDRLQTIQGNPPAEQSPEVPLTVVACRHCGARYWHHLGHMADNGKIAGGPCCFGHEVLTVTEYPTEADARAAWVKWQDATLLPDTQKAVTGDVVKAKGAAQPDTSRGTTRCDDVTASPTLSEIGITKRQSADWQEVELSQVKKAILLEIGRQRMAERSEAGEAPLSIVDKPAHDTREEIATELGWSTGKVAMADKVWKEAVSVPNAAPVKCWQGWRRRRGLFYLEKKKLESFGGRTMLPPKKHHPP